MKNRLKLVLPFLLLLFCINLSMAQRGMRGNPEERAERQTQEMVEKLSLSEAQAAKIKTVNLETGKKMQAAFQAANGDREARRTAMKTIREEHNTEIKKYLTATQFQEWEKIQTERRGKRSEHREGRKKEKHKKGEHKKEKPNNSEQG